MALSWATNRRFLSLLVLCLGLGPNFCSAQSDTTAAVDTITKVTVVKKKHSPKKAIWMSAALPGLGQIYNRRWWKLPIIYGGFAGLAYGIASNEVQRSTYRTAYLAGIDNDPNTINQFAGKYSDANLRQLQSYYQRNRDLCIIFSIVLYTLNIVDATVDAHLFDFDVSDDLTLHTRPFLIQPLGTETPSAGVGVYLTFR